MVTVIEHSTQLSKRAKIYSLDVCSMALDVFFGSKYPEQLKSLFPSMRYQFILKEKKNLVHNKMLMATSFITVKKKKKKETTTKQPK